MENLREAAAIRITDEVVERVDAEIRAMDFDDFRQEEYAHIMSGPGAIEGLYTATFTGFMKGFGEKAAYQGIMGIMYANRLLRYANDLKPLPQHNRFDAIHFLKRQVVKSYSPDNLQLTENEFTVKEFEVRFEAFESLREAIHKFTNPHTKYGAIAVLLLYASDIEPTP
jgi:hypothetical protein